MSTKVGTIAEQKFRLLCLEMDIPIYFPLLDYFGVDAVIQNKNKKLIRIQIKSTVAKDKNRNSFRVGLKHGAKGIAYNKDAFDYLVVYLFSVSTWYFIPSSVTNMATTVRLNPYSDKCKFYKYKSAWHQFK